MVIGLMYVVSDQFTDEVRFGYRKMVVAIARKWHHELTRPRVLPVAVVKPWKPKNPDLIESFENCRKSQIALLVKKDVSISKAGFENPGEEFWANRDLPFYDLPDEVVTHVSTKAWREMTEEVCRPHRPCRPEQEEIDRQKVVLGVSPN